MTATDPHLSNVDRADRGQPAEYWCVCGPYDVYCPCEDSAPPSWTWGDRVGVAASLALWVLILAVLAYGVTV